MLPHRIDFKFLKRLARAKRDYLLQAEQTARVKKAVAALKGSLKLLDDCTQMGFRVTFTPKSARSVSRGAKRKSRR